MRLMLCAHGARNLHHHVMTNAWIAMVTKLTPPPTKNCRNMPILSARFVISIAMIDIVISKSNVRYSPESRTQASPGYELAPLHSTNCLT
jgi:hypothetical protein